MERVFRDGIVLSDSHNTDVTGGLRGKLEACQNLFHTKALQSIEIFDGRNAAHYRDVLNQSPFRHTSIVRF